jgi:thioredoxin reductase (NADPH)
MAKPVILTVDDDPQVLSAIDRDLRNHFGGDYRVVRAASGEEALNALRELKNRNNAVALLLADQRMPVMTGTDFLESAKDVFPDARKVLLTAYADTQAAIDSINRVGLDHYLMKPWDPPEQNLYPVLDDLLDDWQANTRLPYEGIRIAGSLISPSSHDIKDFLATNQIPYEWVDVDIDVEMRARVEQLCGDSLRLPVVFFPDGDVMIAPDKRALADKCGLQTKAGQKFYDLIIVGGGPAGLAAAVYGGSEGLRTLMIERSAPGGQAGTSSRIENYLGFPKGLSGADLARRAATQARRFGVEIITAQEVMNVRIQQPYKFVTLSDGTELSSHALILATGVATRKLDAPGVQQVTGAGVYYGAALTEASYYRDCDVFVVGGANSAGQGAVFFARYARSVTMMVRSYLRKEMSSYLIDQIKQTKNIKVLEGVEVQSVHGDNHLEAITYRWRDSGEVVTVPASAMFIFIGAAPHTELVSELVERDADGFILTGLDLIRENRLPRGWPERDPFHLETSVPGVFAAGDVRRGSSKRIANAVGEGAVAVQLVHRYLDTV